MILGINGSEPNWMNFIVTGYKHTKYNSSSDVNKSDGIDIGVE